MVVTKIKQGKPKLNAENVILIFNLWKKKEKKKITGHKLTHTFAKRIEDNTNDNNNNSNDNNNNNNNNNKTKIKTIKQKEIKKMALFS